MFNHQAITCLAVVLCIVPSLTSGTPSTAAMSVFLPQPCNCGTEFAPVCGTNKKQYMNQCLALCEGAVIGNIGLCASVPPVVLPPIITLPTPAPGTCTCGPDFNPVCGSNGQNYANACWAGCAGCSVISQGVCGTTVPQPPIVFPPVVPPTCTCVGYQPVCGVNGVTYPNFCAAQCQGVQIAYWGACQTRPPICSCPLDYNPVCGIDGKTYPNQCSANCAKVPIAYYGACRGGQWPGNTCNTCPTNYNPVCATDGNTYPNSCLASCRGLGVVRPGACSWGPGPNPGPSPSPKPPCGCSFDNNPVCGVNGRTYSNPCEASCAGVEVFKQGPCVAVRRLDESASDKVDSATATTTGTVARSLVNTDDIDATCGCSRTFVDFVCGKNGQTYGSQCWADCLGVMVAHKGTCAKPTGPVPPTHECSCAGAAASPVCGSDGRTYASACEAECNGVQVKQDRPCMSTRKMMK